MPFRPQEYNALCCPSQLDDGVICQIIELLVFEITKMYLCYDIFVALAKEVTYKIEVCRHHNCFYSTMPI
jgi:hypothetical protein